jgi:WD40 repeat protein
LSNLYSLAFGPEGTTLFTGHNEGSLRAWHLPTRQSVGVVFQPARGDSISRWLLPDSQHPRMAALFFNPTPVVAFDVFHVAGDHFHNSILRE